MNSFAKLFSSLALVSTMTVASSASAAGSSSWLTVTRVKTYGTGSAIIYVSGPSLPTACPTKDAFRINKNHAGSSEMIRLVLSALLAGKQIRVATTDSCSPALDDIEWVETQ